MNGFDVKAALEVADKMRSIARRADMFGYTREILIEEILSYAHNMERVAEFIETQMEDQLSDEYWNKICLEDSDGYACNQHLEAA
jgi:hypothetical protein